MKIRVLDRILVFFAGIVLLFTGAGVIAERFFDVPVFDTLADMLFESLTVVIVAEAVLVVLGVYCVGMMFRRYKGKRGAAHGRWGAEHLHQGHRKSGTEVHR